MTEASKTTTRQAELDRRREYEALAQCERCLRREQLISTEYGDLCQQCEWRQAEHDEARDRFDHLSASNFGFLSEDY